MPKYGLAVTSRICIHTKKTRPPNATTARTPPSSVMVLLAGCGTLGCMASLSMVIHRRRGAPHFTSTVPPVLPGHKGPMVMDAVGFWIRLCLRVDTTTIGRVQSRPKGRRFYPHRLLQWTGWRAVTACSDDGTAGKLHHDRRPLARRRPHLEASAEKARTLVHSQQPQLAPVRQLAQATCEPEPASVILNDHPHQVARAAQGETGPGGPGVSANVVQGLLGDAEQEELRLRVKLAGDPPALVLLGGEYLADKVMKVLAHPHLDVDLASLLGDREDEQSANDHDAADLRQGMVSVGGGPNGAGEHEGPGPPPREQ